MQLKRKTIQEIFEEGKILDKKDKDQLDKILSDADEFLGKSQADVLTDDEVTKLYEDAKKFWDDFRETLIQIQYVLNINEELYNFLRKKIQNEFEYDQQDLTAAVTLNQSFFKENKNLNPIRVSITEVSLMQHLLGKVVVKGIGKQAERYLYINQELGRISQVYNWYNDKSEKLSKNISDWNLTLEQRVQKEEQEDQPELEAPDMKIEK